MPETRDLTETITAALTSPNPTAAVTLLIANTLREAAETQRATLARNEKRIRATYSAEYTRALMFAEQRSAADLDAQANRIATLTTVTTLPVQRNLRSVA